MAIGKPGAYATVERPRQNYIGDAFNQVNDAFAQQAKLSELEKRLIDAKESHKLPKSNLHVNDLPSEDLINKEMNRGIGSRVGYSSRGRNGNSEIHVDGLGYAIIKGNADVSEYHPIRGLSKADEMKAVDKIRGVVSEIYDKYGNNSDAKQLEPEINPETKPSFSNIGDRFEFSGKGYEVTGNDNGQIELSPMDGGKKITMSKKNIDVVAYKLKPIPPTNTAPSEQSPTTQTDSNNNLTPNNQSTIIPPTSQSEAGKSGGKTMKTLAEKKAKLAEHETAMGGLKRMSDEWADHAGYAKTLREEIAKEEKKLPKPDLHPMINKREDGSFGVKIPFDMKDAFKKQFSSAKPAYDASGKFVEWTVGKLSGQKLNAWLQDKIPHIEEKAKSKAEWEDKIASMHPLTGNTYDIKDQLKEKFDASFDGKNWRVPQEHKEAAQEFVNEHNESKKGERKASKEARQKELSRAPTSEERKSIDAWMEQNPADEDALMDDKFRYSVQTSGWHIKPEPKKDQPKQDWSKYSRGDD